MPPDPPGYVASSAADPSAGPRHDLPGLDPRTVLHELQVHQAELEAQNQELRQTRDELEASQARYFDLYDLAPVGYATLSSEGTVIEANLTLGDCLGIARSTLIGRSLSHFVHGNSVNAYSSHFQRLFETGEPSSIEVEIVKKDGGTIWGRINSTAYDDAPGGSRSYRITLTDITERKQMEDVLRFGHETLEARVQKRTKELRDATAYNRSLIESSVDPLVTIDKDGRVLDVNEAAFRATGVSREQMVGSDFSDYFIDPERARAGCAQAFRDGSVQNYELELKHRDGSTMPVECSAGVYRDTEGTVAGVIVTARDITERKRSDAEREQTNLFREIGRRVLQIFNERGELKDSIRRVVEALKSLTGFEAVGIRLRAGNDFPYFVQDGFPEDFLATEDTLVERGLDGGVRLDEEGNVRLECTCGLVLSGKTDPSNPILTPGGSFWTNDSRHLLDLPPCEDPRTRPRNKCIRRGYSSFALVPIRTKDEVLGLIQLNDKGRGRFTLYAVELLEEAAAFLGAALMRRRAEEELRTLQAELERRVRERTAELAKSRQLLDETAHLSRVGGWEVDLLTNELTWTDVTYEIHEVAPGVRQSVEAGINYYAPESRPRIAEVFGRLARTGEPFDEELELITAKGNRIWVRAVGRAHFEGGKVVRVGGVFQDIDSRKRWTASLQEANRELEAFSYSISHELRTPLRAIDGFSALISREYEDLLDAEGRRLLGEVRWNAGRMGQLVDDLLAFSRAGHADLSFSSVDMKDCAKGAFAQIVPDSASSSRIGFSLGDLPVATGDAALLQRVWANLLSNAVKFSSERERPEIRVEGSVAGGEAVYRVRDNGVGFDMNYVDKLFGVFHRLHALHEFEGTGVGLALVRRIVVRHGGRVWAEGEQDRGATFSFSLPAKARPEVSMSWRKLVLDPGTAGSNAPVKGFPTRN